MISRPDRSPCASAEAILDATLASFGQVLFSTSRIAGALVVCATVTSPAHLAMGLAGATLANLLALLTGVARDDIRAGLYGVNGVLLGLGIAAWTRPSISSFALLAVFALLMTAVTAASRHAVTRVLGLPSLSLPFHLALWGFLLAARWMPGLEWRAIPMDGALPDFGDASSLGGNLLRSLGAILFLPNIPSGAMVLGALLAASRVGALLAAGGFLLAWAALSVPGAPFGSFAKLYCCANAALTAFALGAVFFMPSPRSTALAVASVMVCAAIYLALVRAATATGLPLLFLPFNLTTILLIAAMKARQGACSPVARLDTTVSPEQDRARHLVRIERFGWSFPVRFSLPFNGTWDVTQGWDGPITHRGLWRHGWDFEVTDSSGRTFEGDGATRKDYLCSDLPILAPADGVVVDSVDHLPDNVPGVADEVNNWGNCLVLRHAEGLYTLLAHLAGGSIRVRAGAFVRRGEHLAACGSSGRAPAAHLHFQFQAKPAIGAPTIPGELHDISLHVDGAASIRGVHVPRRGERVSNPRRDRGLLEALCRPPGSIAIYDVRRDGRPAGVERLLWDNDLGGRLLLRSLERGTTLALHTAPPVFCALELEGTRGSLLHAVALALSKVPYCADAEIAWEDRLPARVVYPTPLDPIAALGFAVLPASWTDGALRIARRDGVFVVEGRFGHGRRLLSTEARLDLRRGLTGVRLSRDGRPRLEGALCDEP